MRHAFKIIRFYTCYGFFLILFSFFLSPLFFLFAFLLFCLFILEEVIVEVIIEIVFKIFQIIRGKETVNCVCNTCYCCYCTDNSQYPENTVLFLSSSSLLWISSLIRLVFISSSTRLKASFPMVSHLSLSNLFIAGPSFLHLFSLLFSIP